MLKIGPRGARSHQPENTLISLQKAIEMHVDRTQLDTHLSYEAMLIVIYDDRNNLTKNGIHFNTDSKYIIFTLKGKINL